MATIMTNVVRRNVYCFSNTFLRTNQTFQLQVPAIHACTRHNSTDPNPEIQDKPEHEPFVKRRMDSHLSDLRFLYPEFLPDPQINRRHSVREKLERKDMINRRQTIEIPEFYVGSIMAVTASDPHAPGKNNRFVGICILRRDHGLRANFTLRNVVDHQGVEIMYDMYNPTIQRIEVLKLEKRLDEHLVYLRDALPEYSTFSFDMLAEPHPEGAPVPVNPIKVKLKPRPWFARWERMELTGVQDLNLRQKFYDRAAELAKPWVKYDLMKEYREHIHEEDQKVIWEETLPHHVEIQEKWKRGKRHQLLKKK